MPQYDYRAAGAYFITVTLDPRIPFLSRIEDGRTVLLDAGEVVERCWLELPMHFPHASLDLHVVMPDHFHGIVLLAPQANAWQGNSSKGTRAGSLPAIMQAFKSAATRLLRQSGLIAAGSFWQRGYMEHVIRDDEDMFVRRQYILNNPAAWELKRR